MLCLGVLREVTLPGDLRIAVWEPTQKLLRKWAVPGPVCQTLLAPGRCFLSHCVDEVTATGPP